MFLFVLGVILGVGLLAAGQNIVKELDQRRDRREQAFNDAVRAAALQMTNTWAGNHPARPVSPKYTADPRQDNAHEYW